MQKRDGSTEPFEIRKIKRAMLGALSDASGGPASDPSKALVLAIQKIRAWKMDVLRVDDLHRCSIESLYEVGLPEASVAYEQYMLQRRQTRQLRLRPDKNALSEYIHASKYGKWLPGPKRSETFEETVERSTLMHVERWPEHEELIKWAFGLVHEKRVLPSMRSMQFAGAAIKKHNARLYNCCFTLIDRPRVFGEILYLLLCGCGVGFSVQMCHIKKLPRLAPRRSGKQTVKHHKVADTIQGWGIAVNELVASYMHGYWTEFDYSLIRPEGSSLSSGGLAPGHLPLREAIEKIRVILELSRDRQLRPIECHDIVCLLATAVLAGGIRRSSLLSLFSMVDSEMMRAKAQDQFQYGGLNGHRAMANNSVRLSRTNMHRDTFDRVMVENIESASGEPGFFFSDNQNYGPNPCGEIGLNPIAANGSTGFGFCNLTEVNCAVAKNVDELVDAVKAATLIGTMQTAYTDFGWLDKHLPISKSIAEREALLGVGLTGVMDSPELALDEGILARLSSMVVSINKKFAPKFGVKQAARATTIKPSGTASLLLGGVGSGCHAHHARRYFRRVMADCNEPAALVFRAANPHMVEEMPNGNLSLCFPVEAPSSATILRDMSAADQLEVITRLYKHWVVKGTARPDSSPGLTHAVSCTVVYQKGEEEKMVNAIWNRRNEIASMALMRAEAELKVPFLPREEVKTKEDEDRWRQLISKYKPIDWLASLVEDTRPTSARAAACEGDKCEL